MSPTRSSLQPTAQVGVLWAFDLFGAHTCRRVGRPGTLDTLWSGDRSEVEA